MQISYYQEREVVRDGLLEEMTFKQRPKEWEEGRHSGEGSPGQPEPLDAGKFSPVNCRGGWAYEFEPETQIELLPSRRLHSSGGEGQKITTQVSMHIPRQRREDR